MIITRVERWDDYFKVTRTMKCLKEVLMIRVERLYPDQEYPMLVTGLRNHEMTHEEQRAFEAWLNRQIAGDPPEDPRISGSDMP